MILKAARILPYRLIDKFKGGKDRPEKVYGQIICIILARPKIRKHQVSSLSGLRLWFTYLMLSGVISTF
jgi:hypothetical protein